MCNEVNFSMRALIAGTGISLRERTVFVEENALLVGSFPPWCPAEC